MMVAERFLLLQRQPPAHLEEWNLVLLVMNFHVVAQFFGQLFPLIQHRIAMCPFSMQGD